MPNKINEIVFGPLDPLQADCLLEVNESIKNPFRIVNKYVYPNFLTHMITLAVLTPTFYIIKPDAPLASLCTVTTEKALEEINGMTLYLYFLKMYKFYLGFSLIDIYCSDPEEEEEKEEKNNKKEDSIPSLQPTNLSLPPTTMSHFCGVL